MINNLPQTVWVFVLSEWCSLEEINKLDSAYCNNSVRKHFLQILQHEYLLSHVEYRYGSSSSWICKRNIKPKNLFVQIDVLRRFKRPSIEFDISNVSSLTLNNQSQTHATHILFHCPNLTSLNILKSQGVDISLQNLEFKVLSQLKVLNLTLYSPIQQAATLELLVNHTPNLVHLEVCIYLAEISESIFTNFLSNKGHLIHSLRLEFSGKTLYGKTKINERNKQKSSSTSAFTVNNIVDLIIRYCPDLLKLCVFPLLMETGIIQLTS